LPLNQLFPIDAGTDPEALRIVPRSSQKRFYRLQWHSRFGLRTEILSSERHISAGGGRCLIPGFAVAFAELDGFAVLIGRRPRFPDVCSERRLHLDGPDQCEILQRSGVRIWNRLERQKTGDREGDERCEER
jgi:hypothetical protein